MIKNRILYLLLALLLHSANIQAQNLSGFRTLAHYTLIETNLDALGQNDPVMLSNAPFVGVDGIISNGIYHNIDPAGSLMQTPNISRLDHAHVAFSIEFKLTDSLVANHAIVIGGQNWRWLGASVSDEYELQFIVNGATYGTGHSLDTSWNKLAIVYTREDSSAQLYLNDSLIVQSKAALETDPDDKAFTNYDGGIGKTFKGNLRNLIIYGANPSSLWFADRATWIYRWSVFGGLGYEKAQVVGDTMLLGTSCKILQRSIFFSRAPFIEGDTLMPEPDYMYESNDSIFHFEDGAFTLIYNFNMKEGDSLVITGFLDGAGFQCPSSVFVVDSNSNLSVQGVNLRVQLGHVITEGVRDESAVYTIIEGMGFTYKQYLTDGMPGSPMKFGHLIPANALTCHLDGDYWQFCSYQTEAVSFNPGDEDCTSDFTLPALETTNHAIEVSPNPTRGVVHLKSSNRPVKMVRVYSSMGTLIQQINYPDQQFELVGGHRGLLVLHFYLPGEVVVRKLIRH